MILKKGQRIWIVTDDDVFEAAILSVRVPFGTRTLENQTQCALKIRPVDEDINIKNVDNIQKMHVGVEIKEK